MLDWVLDRLVKFALYVFQTADVFPMNIRHLNLIRTMISGNDEQIMSVNTMPR
jgi:hypothetical protein